MNVSIIIISIIIYLVVGIPVCRQQPVVGVVQTSQIREREWLILRAMSDSFGQITRVVTVI